VDGDTIVIKLDRKETKVRLIGVDTPETVHPQKRVEAYGKEASRFTENLLKGEQIYLEYEPGGSRLDKYGRLLAYVYRAPDGLFVNLEIIRQGYGHAYTKYPFQYMDLFREAERRARDGQKGLWGIDQGGKEIEGKISGQKILPLKEAIPKVQLKETQPNFTKEQLQTPSIVFHGNQKSHVFHKPGCRYYNCSNCSAVFNSKEEAMSSGYRPCKICKP
jgi:micrococcal nuclease